MLRALVTIVRSRGLPGDGALGGAGLVVPVAHRQLVGDVLGERAAVGAGEQALLLEQREVAAQGGRRDVEAAGQLADVDGAGLVQRVEDLPHPLGPARGARHGSHLLTQDAQTRITDAR